jgi:hypothetical protein
LIVQNLKTKGNFIMLWLSNPIRSSTNIVFKEREDVFNCDVLVRRLLELVGKLGDGVALKALLQPVNGLYGSFANVSKGLRKLMKVVVDLMVGQSNSAPIAPRPGGRIRVVEAAPSREEEADREEAVPAAMVTTSSLPMILIGSPLLIPTPRSTP